MIVVAHRIVEHLALLLRELDAGANAVRAPAVLAVVAEQSRIEFRVGGRANRTRAHAGERRQSPDAHRRNPRQHGLAQATQFDEHMHHALAKLQRAGQRLAQQSLVLGPDVQTGHRQLDRVLLETVQPRKACGRKEVAVDAQMRVAARSRPIGEFGVDAFAVHHQRRQQSDVLSAETLEQLRGDAVGGLRLHGRAVVHAMLGAEFDEQQPQKMPDLGGRADRRLAPTAAQTLFNRHGGRYAVHGIHFGSARGLNNAARVGVEALEVAALTLVEQDVERQRRLARSAYPRHHVELATRDVHAERLEVVLLGVHDLYRQIGVRFQFSRQCQLLPNNWNLTPIVSFLHGVGSDVHRGVVLPKRAAGVRIGVLAQVVRCAERDDLASGVSAFWTQVDEPVAGADHVQVVLDHQQRMAGVEQLAQRAQQFGDVVEMQSGRGLVEHEQRAALRHRLAARRCAARGFRQEARKFEPLRLAPGKRGNGLPELHVLETHVDDRLQGAHHVAVRRKQPDRFADREIEHVGDVE